MEVGDSTEEREHCAKVRGEEFKCIQKIEEDVIKMIKSGYIQKNVNKTILDGLKNFPSFIEEAKNKHQQSALAFDYINSTIGAADWYFVKRNKRRK